MGGRERERNIRERESTWADLGVGALLGGLLPALPGLGVGRLLARALVVQRVHLLPHTVVQSVAQLPAQLVTQLAIQLCS